jgi:1-acyl-sn-glycerol-3-phosphate acyltransferase
MTVSFMSLWQAMSDVGDRLLPFLDLYQQADHAPPGQWNGDSLDRDPAVIERLFPLCEWLYHHYFQVTSDGWEHVPPEPALVIGSHNGGLSTPDTLMITYDWFARLGTTRPVYALMDPKTWTVMPPLGRLAARVGAVRAEPRMAIAALESGASLLIYPGGSKDVFRPFSDRHKIHLNGQRGFIKLALEYDLPIVPLISYGAHSTLIVLAEIHDQLASWSHGHFPWPFGFDPGVFPIYLGLPWGLAIGPLPNIPFPKPFHLRFCPSIRFERSGEAAAHDRDYVEQCYRQVERTMQTALDQLVVEQQAVAAPKP